MAFDDQARLLHDFTTDSAALEAAIRWMRPRGDTALYDAITFASEKLSRIPDIRVSRRVIILISDGLDTRSRKILTEAQRAALMADAVIFSLSTNDLRWGYSKGEAVLDLLSHATGGNILRAGDEDELKKAFSRVEKTLRTQYAVGYTPANFQLDGSFHSVQVVPRRPRLSVRCRRGYYAARK